MGLRSLEIFYFLQCEDRLQSSESDVYRRQILTSVVDPHAVKVNMPYLLFIVLSKGRTQGCPSFMMLTQLLLYICIRLYNSYYIGNNVISNLYCIIETLVIDNVNKITRIICMV